MRSTNAESKPPTVGKSSSKLQEAIMHYMQGKFSAGNDVNLTMLKPPRKLCLSVENILPERSTSFCQEEQSGSHSDDCKSTKSDPGSSAECSPKVLQTSEPEGASLASHVQLKCLVRARQQRPCQKHGCVSGIPNSRLKGKIAAGKRKEDAVAKDGEEESRAKKKGPGKKAEAMPKKVNKVAKDPEDRKPRKEKQPKKQNKNQKEIKKKDDTRKRFTSRAYHQAKQAALRIGKEAQEAKELGRTAFQKAAQESGTWPTRIPESEIFSA